MNKAIRALFVILLISSFSCDQGSFERKTSLDSESDSLSYNLGLKYGATLERETIDIDWPSFISGMKDKHEDEEILLTNTQISKLTKKTNSLKINKRKKDMAEAKKKNEAFLTENKSKSGVITTESGLQYKVLKEGDGQKPGPADIVSVHYMGHLIDGTEFDNSFTRGNPLQLQLNRVIKGWQEGLQLMSVGSRYKLYIPAELGYGARAQAKIPANSTLLFEVELLDIKK